jgi:hypothetical protein
MKDATAKPKRTIKRKPQDKLTIKVNCLNDVKQLADKHKGKDEELDKALQELLAKTGSIVKQEVEKKSAEWELSVSG